MYEHVYDLGLYLFKLGKRSRFLAHKNHKFLLRLTSRSERGSGSARQLKNSDRVQHGPNDRAESAALCESASFDAIVHRSMHPAERHRLMLEEASIDATDQMCIVRCLCASIDASDQNLLEFFEILAEQCEVGIETTLKSDDEKTTNRIIMCV